MTTKEALAVAKEPYYTWDERSSYLAVARLSAALGQVAHELEAYHRFYGPDLPEDPIANAIRHAKRFVDGEMLSKDKAAVVMTLVTELERLRG